MKTPKISKINFVLLGIMIMTIFFCCSTEVQAAQAGDYTYSITDDKATITKYKGSGGDVTIPSILGGFPVTNIGYGAFSGCKELTTINIPQGVTSIGDMAFNNCIGLTIVNMPQGVKSIGEAAFSDCTSLNSISLPQEMVNIGDRAFSDCINLTAINIPEGITSIGFGAFSFTGLTSVNIPQGVTSIGYGAFSFCTSLMTISIPQGVTTIGDFAFWGCSGLISIRFDSASTTIADSDYTIEQSTKIIGNDPSSARIYAAKYNRAFEVIGNNLPSLSLTIVSPTENSQYSVGNTVLISGSGENCDYIGLYVDNHRVEGATIAGNKYSYEYKFSSEGLHTIQLKGLTSSTLTESQIVEIYVASNTSTPKPIVTVTSPANGSSYTIGSSVTVSATATNCVNMSAKWTLQGSIDPHYQNQSFLTQDGSSFITTFTPPVPGAYTIQYYARDSDNKANDPKIVTITMTDNLSVDYTFTVFAGEASITKYIGAGGIVAIPSKLGGFPVTCIGENAFYQCTDITAISFPQGLKRIGYGAFSMCSGLTNISLPQDMAIIGDAAFSMCTGLKDISIPQGVTNMGAAAFYSCSGLTSIRFNSTTTNISDTDNVFPSTTTIIGFEGSSAESYANKHNREFEAIKPIAGLSINKIATTVSVGATETLSAIIMPENGADKSVTWSVFSQSENNVASVTAEGVVMGITPGTAVIKVTSNTDTTKYAECTVTVIPAVDNLALKAALENALILLGSFNIGTANGEVPQIAYDAYNQAIIMASSTENDVSASQVEVDQALSVLDQATIDYLKFTNTLTDVPYGKGRTQAEIVSKYIQLKQTIPNSIFVEEPSVISPYNAGKVDSAFLQNGVNWLNFVRYITGLSDDVTLDDNYTNVSQHGAVLLAAINELNHKPPKPQDMDENFYRLGYDGTSHGNLAIVPSGSPLENSINLMLDDSDSYNTFLGVGHRRWILNPGMKKIGFGVADNLEQAQYSDIYVFDDTRWVNYDSIAWPSKGAFPSDFLNMMGGDINWSISLNPEKYDSSRTANIKVKVTNRKTGIAWESDLSKNYNEIYPQEYFKVSTAGYGIPFGIIFYPGRIFQYQANDIYDVKVTGVFKKNSNIPTTIKYSTSLFDLYPITVNLNKSSTTLEVGQTEQLTIKVLSDNETSTNVKWSVINGDGVVSVSPNGLITAVNPGTEVIRATSIADEAKYADCRVTVTEEPGTDYSATPVVQIETNPEDGNSAGIFVGLKDIRDVQDNLIPAAKLSSYRVDIAYDHNNAVVLNVVDEAQLGEFTFFNNGEDVIITSTADEINEGNNKCDKLFFVPLVLTGTSTSTTDVTIKFTKLTDPNSNDISVPKVTLTFQRGKILNETSQSLSTADAVAGLQYLSEVVTAGTDQGQVNVVNMASILQPEAGATSIKPSVKDVIALMQKLVGLRDDSFQ